MYIEFLTRQYLKLVRTPLNVLRLHVLFPQYKCYWHSLIKSKTLGCCVNSYKYMYIIEHFKINFTQYYSKKIHQTHIHCTTKYNEPTKSKWNKIFIRILCSNLSHKFCHFDGINATDNLTYILHFISPQSNRQQPFNIKK